MRLFFRFQGGTFNLWSDANGEIEQYKSLGWKSYPEKNECIFAWRALAFYSYCPHVRC